MDTWSGTYSAVVVDTNDPQGAGRVRLYVPQVHGDAVTGWAVPVSQGFVLPGDQVVVTYSGADQNYPVFWPSKALVTSVNGQFGGAVVLGPADIGSPPAPGPWSTPGYATNWAGGDSAGAFGALQYRLDGLGRVELVGTVRMTLAAGIAAGTISFSTALPAAFRPARRWRVVADHTSSTSAFKASALFGILTTGVLEIVTASAIAQNDIFYLSAYFPLV